MQFSRIKTRATVIVHDRPAGDVSAIDAEISGTNKVADELGMDQDVDIADSATRRRPSTPPASRTAP